MYFQGIQLLSCLKRRAFLLSVVSSQVLLALFTSHAATAETKLFPRSYAAKHCFITIPQEQRCLFRDEGAVVPVMDLSLEYRKADFMAEIAAKYAVAKDYDRALLFARLIRLPFPKASALAAIAAEYTKAGKTQSAQALLNEALQTVQTANDFYNKRGVLSKIAVQYAVLGQTETASQIFAQGQQSLFSKPILVSFQSEPIGEVAVGLLAAGRTADAEKMIRQLLQAVQTNGLSLPLYPSTLQALLNAGQYDFAIRMVQEVRNPTFKNRWLSDISTHMAQVGEYDRAIQLTQTLPDPTLVSRFSQQASFFNALNDIVKLAAAGNFSDALTATDLLQVPYYRALVLTEIAIKFAEAGQESQAKQTLSQAIKVGNTLWTDALGKTKSGVGLAMIAVRLAEAGRFSEAQEVTQQIQDDSYQVLAMIGIADEYIKAGQNDKALKTLSATSKLVSSLRCDCAN